MENPNETPGTKTNRSDVQPAWREGFMGGKRTDFMRLSLSCLTIQNTQAPAVQLF